jgi:hypothetical protein
LAIATDNSIRIFISMGMSALISSMILLIIFLYRSLNIVGLKMISRYTICINNDT